MFQEPPFFRPVFVDFASVKMFVGTHARLMGTLSSQQKGLESSPHSTAIWPSVGAGCPLVVTSGTHTAYTPRVKTVVVLKAELLDQ